MPDQHKRILKNWLDSYLDLTSGTEPPRLFRLWTGISVIASVLQRKCWIKKGFQTFYPNFYIVLLGPPAARKGVAMGQGYFFLDELDIIMASDSSSKQALTRKLKTTQKKIIIPETGEEYTHSSLTIFSPEFTTLIGYQDLDFLTILVDWFDCGKGKEGVWENDTISRNLERVTGLWVNVLGATTPQLLRSALPSIGIGGGFSSRVLFINAHKGKRICLKEFTEEEKNLTVQLIEDLQLIHELVGEFKFTPECELAFNDWYENRCEEEPNLNQEKFSGYLGRRAAHCYKLMMVVSASRSSSMIIELEDFHKALRLLEDIESHMEDTFRDFGKFEYSEELGRIIGLLKERKILTRGEIFRLFSCEASDKVLDGIIETLRVMGLATTTSNGTETTLTLVEKPTSGKQKV